MGLFSRSETLSEEEQVRQAQLLIIEMRQVSTHSPEKAIKLLRKRAKPLYEALSFHGRVHEELKQLIQAIWSRDPAQAVTELPTVETIPWSAWKEPKVRDLHAKALGMVCEILYCRGRESRSSNDAVLELEALRYFAMDPNTVMAVIGEEDMMFRRSFLVEASQQLDPDSEELGQDFMDHARRTGKKAVALW
ncbi:MAG: hypothetical protein AB1512_24810 [Thermodesulfobacteriota bacterium]